MKRYSSFFFFLFIAFIQLHPLNGIEKINKEVEIDEKDRDSRAKLIGYLRMTDRDKIRLYYNPYNYIPSKKIEKQDIAIKEIDEKELEQKIKEYQECILKVDFLYYLILKVHFLLVSFLIIILFFDLFKIAIF